MTRAKTPLARIPTLPFALLKPSCRFAAGTDGVKMDLSVGANAHTLEFADKSSGSIYANQNPRLRSPG